MTGPALASCPTYHRVRFQTFSSMGSGSHPASHQGSSLALPEDSLRPQPPLRNASCPSERQIHEPSLKEEPPFLGFAVMRF